MRDGHELALLDAREQGVYFRSHLFQAVSVPLSKLELTLGQLVPRRSTRLVWCDEGTSGLADEAAARSLALGWAEVSILDGGTAAWAEHGGELYSGMNVPSKAFGEFVEHTYGTPRISARELKELLDTDADLVVLDSRPLDEFRRMSIPSGTDCPGAELVNRVKEMVTDPRTLVVVNCAGRTRSIIGAQSLIDAGLENPVVALENGTMGWELAGFDVARGAEAHAPEPGPSSLRWAADAAARVAARFGVAIIDSATLDSWLADPARTTYLHDVRTPAEYEAGHLPASRNAPGGQLVQATDEYIGTANGRIVLVDDTGVRATMTASWLRQLGWNDAVVLDTGVATIDESELAKGSSPRSPLARRMAAGVRTIRVSELADRLGEAGLAVLDVGDSLKYRRRGHIPGSWWGVRSRLDQSRQVIGDVTTLVVTSSDGQLAKLAARDAVRHWPHGDILALAGGNKAWRHADHPMQTGFDRATTEPDDVWYKPYDHDDGQAARHMREYLSWEVGLVEQLARDPLIDFRSFPR